MIGHASAPASSANLGPGFDCIALALDLWCRVGATPADDWVVVEGGESNSPPADALVVRAAAAVAPGPWKLEIDNAVPRTRGLGSSAAVSLAVAAAVARASGFEPEDAALLEIVSGLEGHADNAAAAVYGGLVAAAGGAARRLELAPDLAVVLGIPEQPLATVAARQVLPDSVSREAAARSLARSVFLVEALRTGDPAAFAAAAGDELHESYRAPLSPISGAVMDAARNAGAFHAAWSGAGPTVIAFVPIGGTALVVDAMKTTLDGAGEVLTPAVAFDGWR
jgi:homoserine kinase